MAGVVSVQVAGLARLRRTLRTVGVDMNDLKAANAQAAATVASAASRTAPRRTGRMSGTVRGNRAVGRAVVLAGGARAPWAPVIHYGWPARHIKAQPWVLTAARDTQPQWLPEYENNIQSVLDTVHGA